MGCFWMVRRREFQFDGYRTDNAHMPGGWDASIGISITSNLSRSGVINYLRVYILVRNPRPDQTRPDPKHTTSHL